MLPLTISSYKYKTYNKASQHCQYVNFIGTTELFLQNYWSIDLLAIPSKPFALLVDFSALFRDNFNWNSYIPIYTWKQKHKEFLRFLYMCCLYRLKLSSLLKKDYKQQKGIAKHLDSLESDTMHASGHKCSLYNCTVYWQEIPTC